MGRFCKTCAHLRRISVPASGQQSDLINCEMFSCGYSVTIPAPWPALSHTYTSPFYISPRHAIPGDHYPEVLGSTADWTEVMDCPTHELKALK